MNERTTRAAPQAAYEPASITPRPVLLAVLVVLLVLAVLLAVLLPWRHGIPLAPPPAQTGPALLPDPVAALVRYRTAMAGRRDSYGWVDESAGVARIPVARAVELLLEATRERSASAAQERKP